MHRVRHMLLCFAALLLTACSTSPSVPTVDAPARTETTPLDAIFAEAGAEFGVPVSLLKSIGYVETQWQMVRGGVEFEGQKPAFGIMALRGEKLERGAALAGVSVETAQSEPGANVRAAAALLSSYADELNTDRANLGAWAPVTARYSGIESREFQALYVHKEVYRVLREGATVRLGGKVVASLEPLKTPVEPQFIKPPAPQLMPQQQNGTPYYPPLVWRPSADYGSRAYTPFMVIIHTCEGNYVGCLDELRYSSRQASAHYVVNESGSEVSQLVDERNEAWHIATYYRCSLNANMFCSYNGERSNAFTVGIEHAGYAGSNFSAGMIDKSAQLLCGISKRNGISLDRFRIVGHGQLQPEDRHDPGSTWPWDTYLRKAKEKCYSGVSYATGTTANTGSYTGPYNLRSGPGTNYALAGSIAGGVQVSIVCQATGTTHTGPWGSTSLWDKLSSGKWISDAFVYTGSNNTVAPRCN